MSPEIRYESFYLYDEMKAFLEQAAAEHPEWMELRSLVATPQGRDVLLAEITDSTTGTADGKPAYYVQAGLHAPEAAGTTAAAKAT